MTSPAPTPTEGVAPKLDERPFTLRVAGRQIPLSEAPGESDGPVLYFERATLTGEVDWTDHGADVQFTDLGVTG